MRDWWVQEGPLAHLRVCWWVQEGQAGVAHLWVGWVQKSSGVSAEEGQAGVAHLWVGWVQESSGVSAEESPAPLRHDRFTNVNDFVRHISPAPQHYSPLTYSAVPPAAVPLPCPFAAASSATVLSRPRPFRPQPSCPPSPMRLR